MDHVAGVFDDGLLAFGKRVVTLLFVQALALMALFAVDDQN